MNSFTTNSIKETTTTKEKSQQANYKLNNKNINNSENNKRKTLKFIQSQLKRREENTAKNQAALTKLNTKNQTT